MTVITNIQTSRQRRNDLKELPYYNVTSCPLTVHGQFSNSLANDLPTKQLLDKLPGLYDLDLFNLNINEDINPHKNFAYKQFRSNYYSPYKFSERKRSVSDSSLSFIH